MLFVPMVSLLLLGGRRMSPWVIAVALLAGLLTVRPAIIGEQIGPVGAIPIAAVVAFAASPAERRLTKLRGHQGLALAAVMLYSAVVQWPGTVTFVSGLVIGPILAMAGLYVGTHNQVRNCLINLIAMLSCQQTAALAIAELLGWKGNVFFVSLNSASRSGYEYSVTSFGAVSTGSGGVARIFSARLTGPFGEPGVFAAILVMTAAVHLCTTKGWSCWPQIPLWLAILLTQSVAGLALYGTVVVCWWWLVQFKGKTIRPIKRWQLCAASFGIIPALWLAANPTGILQAKTAANAASTEDRLAGASPSQLVATWIQHPFGYSRFGASSAINLVQLSATLGPLVFGFGLWMYLSSLRNTRGRIVAPLVLVNVATVLFAQPPFLYSWLFFSFLATGVARGPDRCEAEREKGFRSRGSSRTDYLVPPTTAI